MNIYAIPPLISAFLLLSFGLFVLFSNAKSKINITGASACFSSFIWLLGYSLMYASKDENSALFWARFGYNGVFFIPLFAYHFVISIFGFQRRRITIVLLYLTSIPFLIANRSDYFLRGMYTYFWGFYPKVGPAYIYFAIFFALIFIRCIMLSYRAMQTRRGSSPLGYNQAKYVLLAFAIASTSVVDYFQNYGIGIYPWGYLSATGWVILIVIAVTKYHLIDINVALLRAAVFTIVFTLVLGIPLGAMILCRSYIERFGYYGMAAPLLIGMILASLGPFLYQFLSRRAEDALLKDQRRYQRILVDLSKSMIGIRNLDELLKTITSTVVDEVKVSFSAVYLKEEGYNSYQLKSCYPEEIKSRFSELIPLDYPLVSLLQQRGKPLLSEEVGKQDKIHLGSGLVVPYFGKKGLIGFLVVGAKHKGHMYTPDDLLVFENFSYASSLAVENCLFWHEIEEHQRQARIAEMDLFSYSVAHEIDNPMTTIKGHVEIIRKILLSLNLPPDILKALLESLDFIAEGQDRTTSMIKALEDYGKPVPPDLLPLKLEDVVATFLKLFVFQIKHHGITLDQEITPNLPPIRGIKQELMQVLVNFSHNSIHALLGVPQGQKRVRLKLELLSPDWIRVTFSDNGYGITPEKMTSIFAPFTTTKASTEGRGMGLFTVRRIIEKHHGRVWAESPGKGRGASLIVELPVAKDITEEDFKKKDKGRRLF